MTRLGVLALQGDVAEHVAMLREVGVVPVLVKLPEHLLGLDGLIIPGGESTAIGKLIVSYGLGKPLRDRARTSFPIWGTCAGMILLAREIAEETSLAGQPLIGVMDIAVRRNGFGRQLESFETELEVRGLGSSFRAVFIRAPYIDSVGERVEVLARLPGGPIVAARQDNLLATAFHPELTADTRFHALFRDMCLAAARVHA